MVLRARVRGRVGRCQVYLQSPEAPQSFGAFPFPSLHAVARTRASCGAAWLAVGRVTGQTVVSNLGAGHGQQEMATGLRVVAPVARREEPGSQALF